MSTNKPDEQFALPVIDHNDETIVIPFDIKDYPVFGKDAGITINRFYFSWRSPVCFLRFCISGSQRLFCVGVRPPKLN